MNTLNYQGNVFRNNTLNKISLRLTTVDFEMFDGNEGQEKINKALDTASSPEHVFQQIFPVAEAALKNTLGFLIYSYLLADIHWLFIILIGFSSTINFFYSMNVNKNRY